MKNPRSVVCTTSQQSINVAEAFEYIVDQMNKPKKYLLLTMVKRTTLRRNDEIRWDYKEILINTDNITTVWPYGDFIIGEVE